VFFFLFIWRPRTLSYLFRPLPFVCLILEIRVPHDPFWEIPSFDDLINWPTVYSSMFDSVHPPLYVSFLVALLLESLVKVLTLFFDLISSFSRCFSSSRSFASELLLVLTIEVVTWWLVRPIPKSPQMSS